MEIFCVTINDTTYHMANGTYYNKNTPNDVIRILENARMNHNRIRIFYGDSKTGRDWLEEYDTIGYVGRSTGSIKIPLLIYSNRSTGGPAILDDCIIKITEKHKILYQLPSYFLPQLTVKEAEPLLRETGYFFSVMANDKVQANFETGKKANNYIAFLQGNRNTK